MMTNVLSPFYGSQCMFELETAHHCSTQYSKEQFW